MLPASRGVSTVVGMALMILLFLAMVATLIVYMQTIGETYRTLSTILETKLSSSTLSNSITAFWYNDTYGDIVINATNRFSRTVLITSIVTVFENLRIVASRHNQTLEGIEIHVYLPNGNEIYSNPQLPIPLCPGCLATINITKTRDVYEGKLITASLTLSSSPVVAVVPVKYVYEVGGIDEDWLWNGEKLYANPKFKYVGIGTSNPRAALHVNGSVILENLPMASGGSYVLMLGPNGELYRAPPMAAGQDSDWLWNGNAMYANPAAVAVGIGTTSPRAPLHVVYSRITKYVVKITNPNGYDLVDYQVRIDVSMVAFQNFKIVDSNGNELPYCFEQPNGECNESRSSVIWVKVPYIPANGETILYVENATENHAVPGYQVFDFYDDFSLGVVDVNKWERYDDNYFVVRDGKLVVRDGTAFRYIVSKRGFAPPIIVEARIMFVAWKDADGSIAVLDGPNRVWNRGYTHLIIGLAGSIWSTYAVYEFTPVSGVGQVCRFVGQGTEFHVAGYVIKSANEIEAFTYVTGTRQTCTITTNGFGNVYVAIVDDAWHDGAQRESAGDQAIVDWVRVRKYAEQEPSVSIEPVIEKDLSKTAMIVEGVLNVTNLTISGIARDDSLIKVLVINDSGYVFWRDVSTIRDNDWLWNGNYLYTTASRVGIGTSSPRYKLDVVGDVRISGRLGTAGYAPDSGYPPGWYGGIHTWDVYAEASIGVGAGGGLGVWVTHENNNGKIILYANGREAIKLIASEGAIYADYYRFTESGTSTEFELDYFPNTPVGNAIGVSHFDGSSWRGVFFVNGSGYVFAPRYYVTEERDEASPRWHIDYVPDNNRLTINYDYGGSPKEVAYVLPSGSVWILGNLSTHGFDPDHGYPRGWSGGIHTWDVYAEGSIGVGRGGSLTVVVSDDSDAQGFIKLNNLWSNQWGQISRWTNRLEIAASDAIGLAVGGIGNTKILIGRYRIDVYDYTVIHEGLDVRGSIWLNDHCLYDVDDIHISGGSDSVGAIYGPYDLTKIVFNQYGIYLYNVDDIHISGGNDNVGAIYGPRDTSKIVFDTYGIKIMPGDGSLEIDLYNSDGMYIRGLSENSVANRILVIDSNGKVYYRYISSFSDNDWYWSNNYLRPNDNARGVDMNGKDIVNVDEISGASPRIYSSSGTIYMESGGTTYVHILNPFTQSTYSYDAVFVCYGDECVITRLSSSMRFKTDVKPLTEYINTSKIYELEPVMFRDKVSNEIGIGFIAEEVAKVLPILVTFDEEGRPDAVKYKLLPVLMLPELKKHEMSIRWLNETVEDLAKEVEELRNALINNQQNVDRDNASQSNAMELTVWRTLSIVAIALATLSLALSRASRR